MNARLDFWFELASPYSYVGAWQIEGICRDAGVELVWRPFLLGPVFSLQGWNTSHYNLDPRRGKYLWRDMERLSQKLGFPWRRPTVFPRNAVLAARVAAAFASEAWISGFIRECFVANFHSDRELNDERVVRELIENVGLDAGRVLGEALQTPRGELLRRNTQAAMDLGIFGAPTCIAGSELFWGEEALEDAADWARRHPLAGLSHDVQAGAYVGPEL